MFHALEYVPEEMSSSLDFRLVAELNCMSGEEPLDVV